MKTFLAKHWGDLLWVLGLLAGVWILLAVAGWLGVIITLGIGIVLCMATGMPEPRIKTVTAVLVLVPMIGIAAWHLYELSKATDWKIVVEVPDKPKNENEKLADEVRKIGRKMSVAVDNIATLSDAFDNFKKDVENRFAYDAGRLDALSDSAKRDRELLNGLSAPPPPPEVPATEASSDPTFEWVPVLPKAPKEVPELDLNPEPKEIPKGKALPSTSPREPMPELRAKIAPTPEKNPNSFPRRLVCNCGHVHDIVGWKPSAIPGAYDPKYARCINPYTGLSCDVSRYEAVAKK